MGELDPRERELRRRSFPHPRPTPYHLMLRTWDYAWWRPVVGVLVALVAFFVGASLIFLVVAALVALVQSGSYAHDVDATISAAGGRGSVAAPTLLALNLSLAAMIPITWAIVRWVHRLRPRWLGSVVPRLRWRFLLVCLLPAVVALLAQVVVSSLLPSGTGEQLSGSLNHFTTGTALSALVVMLTTPLQAAGEEYLFRGYLTQAFGSVVRARRAAQALAVLGPALIFALFHGFSQEPPIFFDRFAFGVVAGILVIRTGGLEAGIAMHVLNNFLAFGLALAFGDLTTALNATGGSSWWMILTTLTQSLVYLGLALWAARAFGLITTGPPVGGALPPAPGDPVLERQPPRV